MSVGSCPQAIDDEQLYNLPDCLLVRLYGRFPSSSNGKLFLDFSGVYINTSGGSEGTKSEETFICHSTSLSEHVKKIISTPFIMFVCMLNTNSVISSNSSLKEQEEFVWDYFQWLIHLVSISGSWTVCE